MPRFPTAIEDYRFIKPTQPDRLLLALFSLKYVMKVHIPTLLFSLALSVCSFADQFRVGASMQVKANSIWFQTDVDLTVWQRFEKIATPAVMESYQTVVLGSRQAWQFTKPLTVKILSYEPQENQVKVEMLAPGRLNATVWWLDGKDFGG